MNEEQYKKENGLTDEDRVLTRLEETVIRLLHHDHEGLTEDEAAERLGCTQQNIANAVARIKQKAPSLFPLMTKNQKLIFDYITEEGLKHNQIAIILKVSEHAVAEIVRQLKDKGIRIDRATKMERYQDFMDGNVREKF